MSLMIKSIGLPLEWMARWTCLR